MRCNELRRKKISGEVTENSMSLGKSFLHRSKPQHLGASSLPECSTTSVFLENKDVQLRKAKRITRQHL